MMARERNLRRAHSAPDRCELCARWTRRQLDWGRCGFDGSTSYGHAPCGKGAFERKGAAR